jgi:probable rRNA maturation factor
MLEYVTPGDFAFLEEENSDDFNPDTGEALLGDIIISVDKVLEQAESFGHSVEREYAFLITHSMLHLFGFDHMQEEEAKVMEEKQKEILLQLNILR